MEKVAFELGILGWARLWDKVGNLLEGIFFKYRLDQLAFEVPFLRFWEEIGLARPVRALGMPG